MILKTMLAKLYREFKNGQEYFTTKKTDTIIYLNGKGLIYGKFQKVDLQDYINYLLSIGYKNAIQD